MDSTSISLLCSLREPARNNAAWERFVDLYTPLIYAWCRKAGLSEVDSGDVVQEVLTVMITGLADFEVERKSRFRSWLRTITVNKARDVQRRNAVRAHGSVKESLSDVESACDTDVFEEKEYRAYVVHRLKQLVEPEFEPLTWQACWKSVTEDKSACDVGKELGISANAVRVAKWRVLRRLRQELDGLLD